MDEMMSYCGLMCRECPAYRATAEADENLKEKTAQKWSKIYGTEIKPEEIHCRGCRSKECFFYGNTCPIKACCRLKGHLHCGTCDLFVCPKAAVVADHVPGVKERLLEEKNRDLFNKK